MVSFFGVPFLSRPSTGVNFEGPTPRPLERFAISKDADGFVVVDESKVFRWELGEWENAESFVALG